jgi:hypothetical protein
MRRSGWNGDHATLSARTDNAGSTFKPIDSGLEVAHWSNVNGFSTGMAATP